MKSLTTPSFWDRSLSAGKSWPSKWCRMDNEIIRHFSPWLESKRGGNFLELGCGSSYLLPYFGKTFNLKIYGIDFSESRLQQTYSYLRDAGILGTLINRDLLIPFEAWQHKFDVVYSGGVVEHFTTPSWVLAVAGAYLKPGGIVITTCPHLKGFWGACGAVLNREADKGYKRMDLKDLIKAHQDAGLEVVYSSYFRWFDPSILNLEKLPRVIQATTYGVFTAINTITGSLNRIKTDDPTLYSDMVVVAEC